MNKQESIREGIALELCLYCHDHDDRDGDCTLEAPCEAALTTATTIMEELHSQGVVILKRGQGFPANALVGSAVEPLIK